MEIIDLFYYLSAFILTVFLIKVFRKPATQLGLIDHPGGRKRHEEPVPLIGGIAIFCSFCFVVLFLDEPLRQYSSLFLGMGILLITGILDDLHDISALAKLAMQVLAASLMVIWGGQTIPTLGNFFGMGEVKLGILEIPFTILCTVGLINAINMIDGLDGLAGGMILISLTWILYCTGFSATSTNALILLIISSTLGFMICNYRHPWRDRASVFLGDAGSLILGFALAWFTVNLSRETPSVSPLAFAWILALPIFDAISLMMRRALKKKNPLSPDREHLHHIFMRAGYSSKASVNILIFISFIMGGIGVIGWQIGLPDYILLLLMVMLFSGHLYFVMHAWKIMKVIKKLKSKI